MKPIHLDYSDHEAAKALYDEAWAHPRRKYTIIPADPEVAWHWIFNNASMLNFGWPTSSNFDVHLKELGPMQPGDLISLDTMYYRNRCGWVYSDNEADTEDEEYVCYHPDTENSEENTESGKRRKCFSWNCPLAHEADREDIRKRDPEFYKSDFKPYPDEQPHDWMILHKRPRYAYVPNITVIGVKPLR